MQARYTSPATIEITDERGVRLIVEGSPSWGEAAEIAMPYVAPAVTWDYLRTERNRKLADCDWTQLSDAPLTGEQVYAWAEYRQSLRDLPELYPDANTVSWPEEPNG